MTAVAPTRLRLLTTSLLVAVGASALLGTGGTFHQWSELDFHYLTLPLVLAGVLLFLSRIVLWARRTRLDALMIWRLVVAKRQHRIAVLPVVQSLLADSTWSRWHGGCWGR